MARSRRYSRVEKNIVKNILSSVGRFFKSIGRFFVRIFKVGDRKLTIMIVPHSQSKVINLQTNVFSPAGVCAAKFAECQRVMIIDLRQSCNYAF